MPDRSFSFDDIMDITEGCLAEKAGHPFGRKINDYRNDRKKRTKRRQADLLSKKMSEHSD